MKNNKSVGGDAHINSPKKHIKEIIMKFIKENVISIIGSLFIALGTSLFLVPTKLSSGGFAGIATVLYYLFNIKMGTTILLLNIPLFILSYFKLGKSFIVKSAISTIIFSKLLDLFNNINSFTTDKLLSSIYGGVLIGIGSALILKAHSSTGGTDLIVQLIKGYKSHLKMGTILVVIDVRNSSLKYYIFRKYRNWFVFFYSYIYNRKNDRYSI